MLQIPLRKLSELKPQPALLDRYETASRDELAAWQRERLAWTLRHVDGLKLTEVAETCSTSLTTTKRRLAEADARIRAHVSLELPGDEEEISHE